MSGNTMLDTSVDLREVQIAARHAGSRTTMRYARARKNPDLHPNHILATYPERITAADWNKYLAGAAYQPPCT